MRISDDRYSRDRLRYDLAVRLIRHQARTHTIRTWTGLTDDRIRKLYRTYIESSAQPARRHRGKSPRQAAFFTRSQRRKYETAVLGSLLSIFEVVPAGGAVVAERAIPGVLRGELLCEAFETYQALLPRTLITFEHAAFLVIALTRGDELRFGCCHECGALLVVDRLSLRDPHCDPCRQFEPAQADPQSRNPLVRNAV